MAAVTTAIIGATVAAGSLAYSIESGQQQRKAQQNALDQQQTAADAQTEAQKTALTNQQRDLDLSNERRRIGLGGGSVGAATTGQGATPTMLGTATSAPTQPASPVQASNTLLGQ